MGDILISKMSLKIMVICLNFSRRKNSFVHSTSTFLAYKWMYHFRSQLQELDNDELQPKEQYESELPRVLEEWMESVKSFLAQLDRLKNSLMPSDGAADFSISTIYYRIHEIAGMIGDLSKEHVQRVTGCVRTDELPGSQFELIPTKMVLLNQLPGETVAIYEGMAKEILRKMGIDPATSFSDQQWIDWERNQFIANELDHLQRFGLEKLAITQSLLALTREFTGALESLGSSCESLKGKVSRLRRDRLESPLRMPDEPVIANNIEVTDHMLIETGNLSNLITDNISQLQPVLTTKSILAPALYGAEVSLRTQIQETSQWLQSCQSLLPMSREESQMRKLLASATQTRINL